MNSFQQEIHDTSQAFFALDVSWSFAQDKDRSRLGPLVCSFPSTTVAALPPRTTLEAVGKDTWDELLLPGTIPAATEAPKTFWICQSAAISRGEQINATLLTLPCCRPKPLTTWTSRQLRWHPWRRSCGHRMPPPPWLQFLQFIRYKRASWLWPWCCGS